MKFGTRLGMLCVALCLGACVSTGESVVGRSAVERPAWVEGDVGEEPHKFVMLVFKKTDIYRLELGIKQAQAAAVAAAPRLLRERVLRDLNVAAETALGAAQARDVKPRIEAIHAQIVPMRDAPDAFPAKTYHEEIQRESPTGIRVSYDVSVLVSVSRHDYNLQMIDAMQRMLASDIPALRKVGQQLQKEFSPENSSQD